MDYEAMSNAYNNAKNAEPWGERKKPDLLKHYSTGTVARMDTEVDYAIVRMPSGEYIIARSHRLGSLDYDFVATTNNLHEAHAIVKGLSK